MTPSAWRLKDPGLMDIRVCDLHMTQLPAQRGLPSGEWEPDDSGQGCWVCWYIESHGRGPWPEGEHHGQQ